VLTIWGRLNSHNVKKVAWFAEEAGLAYARHDVGGQFGMDSDYLAKNPNAMIPTIEDGEVTLWESNAILRYLAARHAPDRFWPGSPASRAMADRWMDWQIDYAEAQRDAFINLIRRSEDQRDAEAIKRSAEACAKKMAILDAHLAQSPWLSGDSFGIGDVPMGVYAYTWFTLPIERPNLPNLADWYDGLQARDGYASQVMIPLT
jgi:glutathione S-transferase